MTTPETALYKRYLLEQLFTNWQVFIRSDHEIYSLFFVQLAPLRDVDVAMYETVMGRTFCPSQIVI